MATDMVTAATARRSGPRKLNVGLLASTIAIIAIAAPSIYFWHAHQTRKLSESLLERGDIMAAEENWQAASDAYYRVWEIRREPELLGKLAPAYDKFALNHNRLGVIASYQRAVGELPDRSDLRYRLSELLLMDGQNELALEQSEKVLENNPADPTANQVAVAFVARSPSVPASQSRVLIHSSRSRTAYVANQNDFRLAVTLANFIRTDLEAKNGSQLARQADAVMNRLVDVLPEDAEAYYARYRYKLMNRLPGPRGRSGSGRTPGSREPNVSAAIGVGLAA